MVKVLSVWARRRTMRLLPSRRSYLRRRKVDRRLTEKTKALLLKSASLGFGPSVGEFATKEFVKALDCLPLSECRIPELHLPSKTPMGSGWARNRRDRRPNVASHAHFVHSWAGGWRCWLCPAWSKRPLKGRCAGAGAAPTPDVSLSFYDRRLPVFSADSRLKEGSGDSWQEWGPTILDSDQLSRTLDIGGPFYRSTGRQAG